MKSLFFSFVVSICLLAGNRATAQNNNSPFKNGDWFECEMEFENGMPVFRNHYWNHDTTAKNSQLLSLRFTYGGKTADGADKWNYKVLRFKTMVMNADGIKEKPNLFCFDTWYPPYFEENFDSIRNSLTGNLLLKNSAVTKHEHNYMADFKLSPLAAISDREPDPDWQGRMFSVSVKTKPDELVTLIEQTTDIVFQPSLLNKGAQAPNSITPYLLPNGLPYAFSDKNQHKVITIAKASFDLPNKAVVKIIDDRTQSEPDKFLSLVILRPSNSQFVVGETGIPNFIKLTDQELSKTYSLSAGTEFEISYGTTWKSLVYEKDTSVVLTNNSLSIYIEPGDTIYIHVRNGKTAQLKVSGNRNNTWYNNQKLAPTISEITNAPITPEFKSYLLLSNELEARFNTIYRGSDRKEIKNSILDFFWLKSYNYGSIYYTESPNTKWHRQPFASFYNFKNGIFLFENCIPFDNSFEAQYHRSVAFHSNFILYYDLMELLAFPYYNKSIIKKNEQKFDYYLAQCGDPLMRQTIEEKLIGYRTSQQGQKFPLSKLTTEENKEVDIRASKGKYRLLLFNWNSSQVTNFIELSNNIPDNIESIIYFYGELDCRGDNYITSILEDEGKKDLLEKSRNLTIIIGNPIDYPITQQITRQITITHENNTMFLYDENGVILRVWTIPFNSEKSFFDDCKKQIEDEIQKRQSEAKSNLSQILLIAVIAVLLTALMAWAIYRYRINRLKQQTEREKMIQELKLKSVQSQLNPHFLFNALNSIQHLVNDDKTQQANRYLVGFSELLRGVLQNADNRLVPLTDELAIIDRYCDLEKLRTQFTFDLNVKTATPPDIIEVPYMLLQPIVENAIKHGISKAAGEGRLRVDITEVGSYLHIKALDNGPGFGVLPLEQLVGKGKGLKLSVEKLQNVYGDDAELAIADNPDGQGGMVTLKLKIG